MQPNTQLPPTGNQEYSTDYLNSIASQPAVKTVNPLVLWGLIGGVLVLAIVIVLFVLAGTGNGTSNSSLASVAAKLDNLQKTSESAQKNLQSGELRSINSSLTLALTNANRDIAKPLEAQDITLKEPKKNRSITRVNSDFKSLEARLEDARLNAVFDRTYAREMTFSLKTLHSDMSVLYKSTRSKSLKGILSTTDTNLKPLRSSFENFNGS